MSNLFNENMSYSQARTLFFQTVRGKTKDDVERIKEEYSAIIPIITQKEFQNRDRWMLTSEKLM